jgi:hypothetical protein
MNKINRLRNCEIQYPDFIRWEREQTFKHATYESCILIRKFLSCRTSIPSIPFLPLLRGMAGVLAPSKATAPVTTVSPLLFCLCRWSSAFSRRSAALFLGMVTPLFSNHCTRTITNATCPKHFHSSLSKNATT